MWTEEEAKGKWCPEARVIVADGGEDRSAMAAGNVANNGRSLSNCIGSACMMWRWLAPLSKLKGEAERSGYCGKGGPV